MAGKLTHFEIPADDTARARGFYEALCGWSFEAWDGPVEYHQTQAGGGPSGAVYPRQEGSSGIRVWLETDDVASDIARVRELGGRATDREPIPGVGWYSICRDPEGNEFGLMQSDASAPGGS